MGKTVEISGKKLYLKATAGTLRLYRNEFGRDILQDMAKLMKTLDNAKNGETEFTAFDLTVFENVAYIMARQGDPENTPADIDTWLDQFETFSIYQVLPEILELWGLNQLSIVDSKKKRGQVAVN